MYKRLVDYQCSLILLSIPTRAQYWATPLCNNVMKQSGMDGQDVRGLSGFFSSEVLMDAISAKLSQNESTLKSKEPFFWFVLLQSF